MMTKKQHFVPQFLLRKFSLSNDEKRIGMFSITHDKFFKSTAIRDQAHENHFYGEQEIETALSEVEGVASKIIGNAVEGESLPARLSKEHHALLMFTLFQGARTRLAADETNEAIDKIVKRLASDVPELKDSVDEVSVRLVNAPAFNLGMVALAHPIAIDLRYKLFCNRTPIPFVISDHPVVLYNQFMEPRNLYGSNIGLAAKGLQVFFPLSPKHTLVLFDSWAYKVGGKKLSSQRVEVTDKKDVDSLNLLQAANANRHLFFNQQIAESEVRKLVVKSSKFRQSEKSELNEYPSVVGDGSLLHLHKADVRTNLQLNCIFIPPHVKRFELSNHVVHVRDLNLCKLHDEFVKLGRVD